ncbi:MAG: large-conductance mechanosensitive channel protein MscL [Bacteroidales bacterium]|jgi:large conductance mechanosensitive channel|nr:large-conductance mechanosensitive channel protein MscL [Bacteroidales bacterium]MDY0084611.1 large-conductance mechanosensitive channel protein MscL [Bacteroidales bacterium]
MKLINEFKAFAMRGNVIDMAVGIVIGGAFGKIVSSFVADVIMPPIGLLVGGVNFSDLQLTIKEGIPAQLDAAGNVVSELIPAVTINYGNFIQVVVDFLIIAFAIFMVIKAMNSVKKKEEAKPAAPPAPSKEEVLLTEIRDLLKNK